MVHIRKLAERATESAARRERAAGYADGINGMNPPSPDDLSDAYWRGYSDGARAAHMTQDYYPDAHEARGF